MHHGYQYPSVMICTKYDILQKVIRLFLKQKACFNKLDIVFLFCTFLSYSIYKIVDCIFCEKRLCIFCIKPVLCRIKNIWRSLYLLYIWNVCKIPSPYFLVLFYKSNTFSYLVIFSQNFRWIVTLKSVCIFHKNNNSMNYIF